MHVLLILMLVSGCVGDGSDDNAGRKKPALKQSPLPEDDDAVCRSSCVACADWQWGDWSPAPSTVCTGQAFTQQRAATRNCSNVCAELNCPQQEIAEREQQGTKTCHAVQPSCTRSCLEACGSWDDANWSSWLPAASTVCQGKNFIKYRSATRTCTNLCTDVQCLRHKTEGEEVQGTRNCSDNKVVADNTSDMQLSDYFMQPGFLRSPFSQLFDTMATRCSHPYTASGNYSNKQWMLSRTQANYPRYCQEFNKLYDYLPWLSKEKARFRFNYSVNPFRYAYDENRIISLRNKKFAEAWRAYQKLYQWLVTHCAKSNDCLNFLFTPDKFVNRHNAQQEYWGYYQVLDDKLNNSSVLSKPLLIGGRPSYAQDRGLYYKKNTFPATFTAYAQDRRNRCRKQWPNYQDRVQSVVCNPGKTGTWPCGAGTSFNCDKLFHRHTDKHGKQIQRRCWFAHTPNADLPSDVRFRECLNQFWGFPEE